MGQILNAELVATRLGKDKKSGNGFMALCPAHNDKNPSLSVTDGENGKLLVHCHAGCKQRDIIAALKRLDLWPQPAMKQVHSPKKRLVATYDYYAPDSGELVFQVLRYDPKDFRQRRPDGRNGWIYKVSSEYRLPYNLPAVRASSGIVCVVEGEKDVNALAALGIVATCNPGGAGKWEAHYSAHLEGRDVCILPDNDKPGEDHAKLVGRQLQGIARSIRLLKLPGLPDKGDVSDFLANGGTAQQLSSLISTAPVWTADEDNQVNLTQPLSKHAQALEIGSDVEIAKRLLEALQDRHGQVVYTENAFWHFVGTHWDRFSDEEMRRACHQFDGAFYYSVSGRQTPVRLNKSRIDSIINESAALSSSPAFFAEPASGINCRSGFIRFDGQGSPTLEPHDPNHRCRHVLPGKWPSSAGVELPESSLLSHLLTGSFHGDEDAEDKMQLIAELAGATALGYATKIKQPRAVILYGLTAENGKSQILEVLRGLLPPSAICSIPVARMADEKHVVGLAGKLLNASDELSGDAVASDIFKAVVTGEPVEGRDVFKSRMEFRPVAQHVFATNTLPSFKGGIDRGVQRRLLVVPFQRTIPLNERIENIGRRIPLEEADLLLAWAVNGASRVFKNRNFTIPASCISAFNNWIYEADPVLAWLKECTIEVDAANNPGVTCRFAHNTFINWAEQEGFPRHRFPSINSFSQRVRAYYPNLRGSRNNSRRTMHGFAIKVYDSTVTPDW